MHELDFRRLVRADFPLLGRWLATPHVARWWHHDASPAGVEADFGDTVDGRDPTDIFVVLLQGRAVGLMQSHAFAHNPGYAQALAPWLELPARAFSLDYLLGEPDVLRQGVASEMLAAFADTVWWDHPGASAIVVPVQSGNVASWRALERAGFRHVADGDLAPDNPADGREHRIYRLDSPRPELSAFPSSRTRPRPAPTARRTRPVRSAPARPAR